MVHRRKCHICGQEAGRLLDPDYRKPICDCCYADNYPCCTACGISCTKAHIDPDEVLCLKCLPKYGSAAARLSTATTTTSAARSMS